MLAWWAHGGGDWWISGRSRSGNAKWLMRHHQDLIVYTFSLNDSPSLPVAVDEFKKWNWVKSGEWQVKSGKQLPERLWLGEQGDPVHPKEISVQCSLEGLMLKLWSSHTLATWCQQLTLWKRPWGWARLKTEGEEGDRGWDGWMASPIQWTCTWTNSGRWWGTGRPGVLQSMGSQRVGHDLATE